VVTNDPRAFLAIDLGAATKSAALVGRLGGRWRLLGSMALPATVPIDAIIERLVGNVLAADATIGEDIEAEALGRPASWPRLVVRSAPPPGVAVLAATESTRRRLEATAVAAGLRPTGASLDRGDALELLRVGLARGSDIVLAGTDDPPSRSERGGLAALTAVVEAIGERRPEATIVLSGALALLVPDTTHDEARLAAVTAGRSRPRGEGPTRIYAPAPGYPARGDPLVDLLDRLAGRPNDALAGVARTTASLAAILDRRVETVGVGLDAGIRVAAWPSTDDDARDGVTMRSAIVSTGGLVPERLDDATVDGVLAWSTIPLDRIRLRDRLGDLRRAPWGDPDGEGAALRLAAARAALARLIHATPALGELQPPDLVIATGGAFAPAPGPAVALAMADVLRRAGACQFAFDHARLMGPLGAIPVESERRLLLRDLADDLLAPLGSVVSPQGLRAGRSAGRVVVHAGAGSSELNLVPGGLQLVDLPPGQVATAEFEFRDPVVLGTRGRRFAVEVGGGLGGLLIDLRDVPLHLPDRLEHRRELLAAWQGALWAGGDR
jgi:hypothetical protein